MRLSGVAAVLLVGVACSSLEESRPAEGVGSLRQALIAQPLRQLGDPVRDRVPDAMPQAVSCNASKQCLVAWLQRAEGVEQVVQSISLPVRVLLVQRFDASGPIDARPTPIAQGVDLGGARVGMGPAGELLIAWVEDYRVFAQRFASDGLTPIDTEPVALTSQGNAFESYRLVDVVHTEGTYAVFLEDEDGWLGLVRLRDGQLLADSARDAFYIRQGQVARGPGTEVGMTNGRMFRRLDIATGQFLDQSNVLFSHQREGQSAGLTYNGTDYVVAWPADNKIYANLISNEGVVSEPGHDLVPAGHEVAAGPSIAYPMKLFFDGTHTVAFYQYTHPGPLGSLALGEHGERANGDLASAWDQVVVDGRVGEGQVTFLSADAGFVSYRTESLTDGEVTRATGGFLTASSSGKPAVGEQRLLGSQTRGQLSSTSASNGRDFLVAYRDSAEEVHVRVVDGGTGKPIGAALSVGVYPTGVNDAFNLTWTGKVYLLQVGKALHPVACDGTVVGPARQVPENASVACNGDLCALAYDTGDQLVVARMDATDGHLLDAPQLVAATGVGSGIAVAANTSPAAEARTFLVAWSTPFSSIRGAFVSAASGAVSASQELMKTSIALVAVSAATDGNDFMVAGGGKAVVVSADSQSTVPDAPTLSAHPLWHDGARYGGFQYEQQVERIHFLAPNGAREQMEQGAFDSQPLAALESAAGTRFGRSLVTEHAFDPAEQAYVIAGRLLDSETTPALPQRPGSPCSFTGLGGGAGGAGAGGESVEGGEGGTAPNPNGGTTSAGTSSGGISAGASSGGTTSGGTTSGGIGAQPSDPSAAGQGGATTELPSAGTSNGGRAPDFNSAGIGGQPAPEETAGAGETASPRATPADSGCSCTLPVGTGDSPLPLVATALLVLLQRRRRALWRLAGTS